MLVERGGATRDPRTDALEAGGSVLCCEFQVNALRNRVSVVCPVVHGTRFGPARCSGFLEQPSGRALLGISRRPWEKSSDCFPLAVASPSSL